MQPAGHPPVLAHVKLRAFLMASTLTMWACGGENESSDEPGLETGPCLSGQQCAAGLVCASEVCVDLGGSGDDDGSSPTPSPGDQPGGTGGPGADGGDAPADGATGGADADADAGGEGDPGGDPSADDGAAEGGADDDAGAGGWCPVPPAALSCTTTCDLFQFECYECPHEPGDLCTYYDYQYDACLSSCEYVKSTPGDFTYEVFACRQFAGSDCSDADVDCLLEIDCAGA